MLKHISVGRFLLVLAVALGLAFMGQTSLQAATQSWDSAGGGVLGGNGTWNSAATNWWSPSDLAWTSGNTAFFGGATASTVTIVGSQTAAGLTFGSAANYTLAASAGTLNLLGPAPLISLSTAATNTISSAITGSGDVTIQAGTGVVQFTNTNAYTGGTTVTSGVLALTATNGLNLGSGTVALNGGTLRFLANSTYNTSSLVPSSSTSTVLTLGAAGGTINVSSSASGTFATNEISVQIKGLISGAGNLTVTGGSGTNSATNPYLLELGSQNTYSGGTTTVNNATISFENANNGGTGPVDILPTATILNLVNNGWFNFNNGTANQTISGLIGDTTGRISTANGGVANLGITPAAGKTYVFNGAIAAATFLGKAGANNNASVIINGAGTQVFAGADSFYTTTITAGTLQLGNAGTTGTLQTAGVINDNGTLAFNRTNNVVQGTDFSTTAIGGAGGIWQEGTAILTLNLANTFSGSTTISGGSVGLTNVNALQNSTAILNVPTNGLIFSTGGTTYNLGGLTGTGSLALSNSTAAALALQVGGNNASTVYSGNLSGGSLAKAGSGTLTLTGTNVYLGTTAVNAGVLLATTTASLPNFSSGTTSVASGATLAIQVLAGSAANGWTDANIASLEADSTLSIAAGGALGIDVVGGGTYTSTASFAVGAGVNGLAKLDAGTLILASSGGYTGATKISAGTLQIGNGGSGAANGSLSTLSAITDNGLLVFNRADTVTQGTDFSGATITGNGGLTQAGGGALVLNTTNSFSGTTNVTSGTLDLQNQFALQGSTFAGGNGTLVLDSVVTANAFNFGGLSGSTNLPLLNSAASPVALTLGSNGVNNTYTGNISDGGLSGSLTKVGAGTQILAGSNSYVGPTSIAAGTLQIGNGGSGPANGSLSTSSVITDNGTLAFNRSDTVTQGIDFAATANLTGTGGVTQAGSGTLILNGVNTYSGTTAATNGTLMMTGSNTSTTSYFSATNAIASGLTVLSIRNSSALSSAAGTAGLAPISLNATGGNLANSIISTTILEIGATIGTDPGGNGADFSYQVVAPLLTNAVNPGKDQISLGSLGNNDDGVGFAAYNANSPSTPRIVALYTPGTTTLATLQEKTQFGQGSGDHLTLGSPTANNTLVLLNPVDMNGGASRQFASIRGVGIVPEGEYAGKIVDTAGGTQNISFNGNGGLIFDSNQTSYTAATLQINNGAIFVAANDPAQAGVTGALGEGNVPIQVGTSSAVNPAGGAAIPTIAGAQIAFMTYGGNNGIGVLGITTSRNINVGGAGVTYASAVLGGMTDDYTAMAGNVALNEDPATAPTTFFARNGGRVDFGGVISGSGSVLIGGNAYVEGSSIGQTGIQLLNNGTIVFNGANTYTGTTNVATGKLYVNGSLAPSSSVSVASAATFGGMGTINGPVSVAAGGVIEGGQSGSGALTLNNGLTFNGAGTVYLGALQPVGDPGLVINGINTLNTNGNNIAISIGSIAGTGNFALIGYNSIQTSSSDTFTLATPLPNRGQGTLVVNGNELDLDVTSVTSIYWTGTASTSWDTTTFNWLDKGVGATQYTDPGDSVIFDDSAVAVGGTTHVTLNSGTVHPSSVTFNNNNYTYTLSGSNGIAGNTGLQLTGVGTVVISTSNTFTGPTSIGPGATLQLGNGTPGNDGSIAQTLSIADNGNLIYDLVGAQTYGGVISGGGALAVQGGMLTLTASNTYSAGTTVSGGTLQLGTGAANKDGALTGNLTDNGALIFNYNGTQTFAGNITGSGAVTKSGLGTVVLGGANTFPAGLTLNAGVVQLANASAVQNSTIAMNTNTSLSFYPGISSFNIGGLSGSGAVALVDANAVPVALTVGTNNQSTTYSGVFSSSGSLIMAGTGTLTLLGSNTYTGSTTINSGIVNMGNATALGSGGAISFGGGTMQFSAASAGFDPSARIGLTNSTGPVSIDTNGQNVTFANGINQPNDLTKLGAGTLILNAANNYGGNTNVRGGELLVNNSIPAGSIITVSSGAAFGGNGSAGNATVLNGGAIDVSANTFGTTLSLTNLTLGQVSTDTETLDFSAGNPNIPELAVGALAADSAAHSITVSFGGGGAVSGTYTLATFTGGSIGGTGSSAFVLAATNSGLNSRESGALVITSSAIDLIVNGYSIIWTGVNHNGQWVGSSNWKQGNNNAATDFVSGDNVILDDSAGSTGGTTNVVIGSGNVNPGSVIFNNNAYNYNISGPFGITSALGGLTLNGTGSVTLATSNTYSGLTNINSGVLIAANSSGLATGSGTLNINGGTMQIGNGGAVGSVNSLPINNNGVLAFARSDSGLVFGNTINGTGSLAELGPGKTTLTATNAYSGSTTITGGILALASTDGSNLGTGTGAAAIAINAGTLQFLANTTYGTPSLSTGAGITLGASGGTISVLSLATTTAGAFAAGEATPQIRSVISGAGNLTVTGGSTTNSATNAYILELGAQNTYSGTTTVNNAIIAFENGNNGGTGPVNILPSTTVLNLVNNGWFNFNNGTANQTISGLTGDATGHVSTSNGGISNLGITPSSGSTYTFPGIIGAVTLLGKAGANPNFSFALSGPGAEQILTGANVYGGPTAITGGTLAIAGGGVLGGGAYAGAIADGDTLIYSSSANQTFSGAISGVGTLNLLPGARTLTLTASNTLTGTTNVSAGTLVLQNGGPNGTLGSSVTTVTPGAVLDLNAGDALGYTNTIPTVTVDGTMVKTNDQSETLTRPITLSGGTMTSAGTIVNANGAWDFFGGSISTSANTSNFIAGVAPFSLRSATADFVTGANSSLTISVPIVQNSNSTNTPLNVTGTGKLILTASSNYPGGTNLSGGTLAVSGSGNLGATTGNLAIINNSTLDLGGTTQSVGNVGASGAGGVVGTIQNGQLNIQNNAMYFQSGALTANLTSGTGGRMLIGGNSSGTVSLGGNNTMTTDPLAVGASVLIGSSTTGAAGTVALTTPTALGPSTEITQLVAGTLDFNGQSNVTVGGILLSGGAAGTLVNNNTSAPVTFGNTIDLGAGTGQVGGAGTLTLTGAVQDGSLNMVGSSLLILTNSNNSYTGSTTISNGTLQLGTGIAGQDGALATSGINNNSTLVFNLVGNQTVAYPISGVGSLTTLGQSVLTLASSNTYTGNTVIGGGTLQIGNGGNVGSLTNSQIIDNATLVFNRGNTATQGTDFSGNITGSGSLRQSGGGTLILNTANTYSGATNVNSGILLLDAGPGHAGALPNTSGVTVAGGAAFDVRGSVSIAGGLASNQNGTIGSVDDFGSAALLTVGGPVSLNRSSLNLELGGNNSGIADEITANGAATLSGVTNINLSTIPGQSIIPGTYTILTASNGLTFAPNSPNRLQLNNVPGGFFQFNLSDTNTAVSLVVTGNPTPATAYWTGASSANNGDTANNWGFGSGLAIQASNWSTDAQGLHDAVQVPGGNTNVFFTAANAVPSGGAVNSTLDSNYSINSLTFATSATANPISSVQIDTFGNSLTIGAGGVSLAASSTSSVSVIDSTASTGQVVVNGNQNWANNSNSQNLTVSSGISSLNGATTLTLNGTGKGGVTLSGVLADGSGTLALNASQAGVTVLSGSNTYSGGTTLGAGTLNINADAALGAVPGTTSTNVNFIGNATLQFAAPATLASTRGVGINSSVTATIDTQGNVVTIGGPISGGGNLTQVGPGGTLILTNTNAYSGATTISAGTLQLGTGIAGQDGSLATSGITNNSALAFDLAGAQTASYNIGGAGSMAMIGGGTLTLTGSNTYASGTTVGSGVVEATTTAALAHYATATVSVASGAVLAVQVNTPTAPNGWTDANITTLKNNINATFAAGSVLGIDVVTGDTYTPSISLGVNAGATNGLVKLGGGMMVLTSPQTYSGTTTVSAGTLQLGTGTSGQDGSLPNSPSIVNNGSLVYDLVGNQSYAGAISGHGNLTVAGPSTLTLTGGNSYTGGTTINAGILNAGSATALGTGSIVFGGGTLQFSAASATWDPSAQIAAGTSAAAMSIDTNSQNVAFAGALTANQSGGLVKLGAGTLTLTATNTYIGDTIVNGGVLALASTNGSNLGTATDATAVTLNGGTLQFLANSTYSTPSISTAAGLTLGASSGTINVATQSTGTFATNEIAPQIRSVITGSGNLTVTGGSAANTPTSPYLLELGAQNTYTGATTINNAFVAFESGNNGGTGPVDILPTTTVLNVVNNGWFNLNNGTANQTISGLTGDATSHVSSSNGGIANLGITPSAGSTYVFNGNIAAVTLLGKVGANNNFSVIINGAGTQVLTGANSYYNTTITAGTLQIGNGGGTGSLATAGTIGDNGTLAFSRSNTAVQGTDFAAAGITGAGTLTQLGPGMLILNAANTYSGGTTVNGGTLQLASAGAIGTGGLTANAGVTDLDGQSPTLPSFSGVAGNVTNTGGANSLLTVEQSINTTFGGSISDGPTNNVGLLMTSPGNSLVLSGVDTFTGGTDVEGGDLIDAANGAIPNGTSLTVGPGATFSFDSTAAAGSIVGASSVVSSHQVAAVPEPGTLALLMAAAGGLAFYLRRRKVGATIG